MGMAVVWITHDLGVVARIAERILVMYGGYIVESGPTARVFRRPEHPYTADLLDAIPAVQGTERPPLRQIPGTPPDPGITSGAARSSRAARRPSSDASRRCPR